MPVSLSVFLSVCLSVFHPSVTLMPGNFEPDLLTGSVCEIERWTGYCEKSGDLGTSNTRPTHRYT